MAFRASFLPSLLHTRPSPSFTSHIDARAFRSFHQQAFRNHPKFQARANQPRVIAHAKSYPRATQGSGRISPLTLGIGAALAFTSFSFLPNRQVRCESLFSPSSSAGSTNNGPLPADPPPGSILSVYELSFGAICGICSGVFIKKGARAIAFLLGGVFILLQYMSSKSYIHVDWAKLGGKYDSAFGTKSSTGYRGPTIGGLYNKIVDFLTSNFQQRASFIAGLVLGIRLG
ncbi:uncharacterized protein I303_103448 [Kwoniella dejecticola CBS 10117]|uniref:FUN14 family protein n=1 Tax=Kwoniella dejecticola CBS 10117 TaxID=1296121 RepID=A0A1A6A6S2_9TREE|nr:uncharacterized protein I303_03471 [Kwoniella dejecticola CBS 10117]OBR85759.1 hypothetical protein I303_03471 [Kwoniella dejecticola CBS 10117]